MTYIRREIFGLSRMRYCGFNRDDISEQGMNWHTADHKGRMYRCTCMKSFRLPGGKRGPCRPHKGSKAFGIQKGMKQYSIGQHLPNFG